MKKAHVIIAILFIAFLSIVTIANVSAIQRIHASGTRTFNSKEDLYSYAKSQPYSNHWNKVESLEPQQINTSQTVGIIPMSEVKEVFWLKESSCIVFKLSNGLSVSADPNKRSVSIENGTLVLK